MKGHVVAALALVIALGLTAGCGSGEKTALSEEKRPTERSIQSWSQMPEMTLDLGKRYRAIVDTTKGSFAIELHARQAPVTVNNFVFLAGEGFYDGLTFHNIVETFMIQTGDPQGDGTGNAGYRIPDELDTTFSYREGIVAMFNTGAPNSGGSQFFICTGPDAANLNREPNYTVFGEVQSGMSVVKTIAASADDEVPISILSIAIETW